MDKYAALDNIINWIENSSSEEFLSSFDKLGNNYDGMTLGEFIDLFTDNVIDDSYDNVLTTDGFVFGLSGKSIDTSISSFNSDEIQNCLDPNSVIDIIEIDFNKKMDLSFSHLDLDMKFNSLNQSNDEIYNLSLSA